MTAQDAVTDPVIGNVFCHFFRFLDGTAADS